MVQQRSREVLTLLPEFLHTCHHLVNNYMTLWLTDQLSNYLPTYLPNKQTNNLTNSMEQSPIFGKQTVSHVVRKFPGFHGMWLLRW
jgi:hypothetical protein